MAGFTLFFLLEQFLHWHHCHWAGSHGRGAPGRFLLGSVSHALALHTPCSVEIVRRSRDEAG